MVCLPYAAAENLKTNPNVMVRILPINLNKNSNYLVLLMLLLALGCRNIADSGTSIMNDSLKINKTEAEWKTSLSSEQYQVLRQKGTEKPFSGEYNIFSENGVYYCAGCGAPLFSSDEKYTSDCGWPSFTDAINDKNIITAQDSSYGMIRTEIMCAACGGHLGHLFDDGPGPGGKRYCVNSVSLKFKKK
jgi:peptide-methionine (R)-S-oxide reductase